MTRQKISDALKEAMKARDAETVSALRLIISALKNRDIATRGDGERSEIGEAETLAVLQNMIKQRQDSIAQYRQGGRPDLVDKEAAEIAVIERFLPAPLDEAELAAAIRAVIAETGATGVKDMGRVIAALKGSHAGRIDFSKAGPLVKALLGGS